MQSNSDVSDQSNVTGGDARDLVPETISGQIRKRTLQRIALVEQAEGIWRFPESLKSISEDTAQEYSDRAVLELIQNGHDAIADGDTGRIRVVLDRPTDDSAGFGVLYVANQGRPFRESNFAAISEVALSDKGPGEGIGNKGLGFRSVLQLTDWPEVFSKSEVDSSEFDGYCFRFATPDDLRALVQDPELASRLIDGVSPLALPVPAEVHDPYVAQLAVEGFSTVIRLPLRNAPALLSAIEQIDALQSPDAPLLIFLDRVSAIEIRHVGRPSDEDRDLRRRDRPFKNLAEDAGIRQVDLGDAGQYLFARTSVSPSAFSAVVAESIEAREIDERWRNWDGEVTVALAVPLGDRDVAGRLYTFLPMSADAASPMAGHVHAPFFTKLARLGINEKVALNGFLLDQLAGLAVDTARILRDGLPHSEAAPLLVDLLCWDPADRIKSHFERAGKHLVDEPFLPMLRSVRWGSLAEIYEWPAGGEAWQVFRADAVAELGNCLLDHSLGVRRVGRLRQFHWEVQETGMYPDATTLADWAERVASEAMGRSNGPLPLARWSDFYDDLAAAFHGDAVPLRGRRLIIDQDGGLVATLGGGNESGTDALFFAPDDEPDAASRLPSSLKALRRRINFAHSEIPWNIPGQPPRKRPGRRFLETNQLVSEYRTDRLLDTLRNMLRRHHSDALRRDALAFLLRLYPTLNDNQRRTLRTLDVWVPSQDGGWVRGHSAAFSPEWQTHGARLFDRFLQLGGSQIEQFAAQSQRWLAPPTAWPLPMDDRNVWVSLLAAVGVTDGLLIDTVGGSLGDREGRFLHPNLIASRDLKLSPEVASAWVVECIRAGWTEGSHPFTNYRFDGPLATIPGVGSVESLTPEARRAFAELLIHRLGTLSDADFEVVVRRPGRKEALQDPHRVPTPLAAFLRSFQWLPADDDELDTFGRARELWLGTDRDPPRFVQRLHPLVRRSLSENSLANLRRLGAPVWGEPAQAARMLADLAKLAGSDGLPDPHINEFRKHCESVWPHLLVPGAAWPWAPGTAVLPAVRLSRLVAHAPESHAPIYVHDEDSPIKRSLLEMTDRSVLIADSRDGTSIAALLATRGVPNVCISTLEVSLSDGNGAVTPDASLPRLIEVAGQWLLLVVGLVVELKSSSFVRRTPEGVQRTLDRLRSARYDHRNTVEIMLDGSVVSPPSGLRSLPLLDPIAPTLVTWGDEDLLRALRGSSQSLAHLLGQPSLQDPLENVFLKLEQFASTSELIATSQIDDATLAEMFQTTDMRIAEVRRSVLGDVSDVARRMLPVLLAMGESTDVDALRADLSLAQDEQALIACVERWAPGVASPEEVLVVATSLTDLSAISEELGLDFRGFNRALAAIGAEEIRHPDRHHRSLAQFVENHADVIVDRLREGWASAAANNASLDGYLESRTLYSIEANPAWLSEFAEPPVSVMKSWVERWLEENGAVADLETPSTLPDLQRLRNVNAGSVGALAEEVATLVAAWCLKHHADLPAHWATGAAIEARSALERAGLGDFRFLDKEELLRVCANALGWPEGAPIACTADGLGLTRDDIERVTRQDDGERRQATEQRTTIPIGGARVPVGPEHLASIANLIAASIGDEFLRQSGRTHLDQIAPRGARASGSKAGGTIVSRMPKLSEDQRLAVGLAGEVAARLWLQRRYRAVRWRSGYSAEFGGHLPDDGLGYDFEVDHRGAVLMFEVKAMSSTTTSIGEFTLSESELATAQANARNDRWRLLLITGVLDAESRMIFELPNPFSAKGRGFFRMMGTGVRFQCAPQREA